jgi:hypothetical protein
VFWFIVAAQLSAPLPTREHWVSPDDVPLELLEGNVLETVGFAITVKPDGRIQDCLIEVSSGNRKLDAYTCKLASQRLRFRPGRLSDGSAVYGVYRTSLKWWAGDDYPPTLRGLSDVYLTVSQLPPKLKSPTVVRLMCGVDETGGISDCVAEDEKSPVELVQIGREQVIKSYTAKPARTIEGVAVQSTQSVLVSFETR